MIRTALLIANDETLKKRIKAIVSSIPHLRLEVVADQSEAWDQVQREEIAVLLIHLPVGEEEGIAGLVRAVCSSSRPIPVLGLSDEYQNDQAVRLLRAGAKDYDGISQGLEKLPHFLATAILDHCRTAKQGPGASTAVDDFFSFVLSPEMTAMMGQVRRVACRDVTLLLTGETGTGKTRLARLIHQLSPRSQEPFLIVDCGALSATLIEREIFGHCRGAFTGADRDRPGKFAAVGRGTLLLDEVNALPLSLQSKLLRAVDDRVYEPVGSNESCVVEARIIAATNFRLDQAVRAGKFRQDLFFRLNVVGFFLPLLRERRGLIAPLANKFLAEFSARENRDLHGFMPETYQLLKDYDWPGNIRELRNAVERAVLLGQGSEIQTSDLPGILPGPEPITSSPAEPNREILLMGSKPLAQTREEAEVIRISAALKKHRNNRLRAASELGISRMALYNKLHKYRLFHFRTCTDRLCRRTSG